MKLSFCINWRQYFQKTHLRKSVYMSTVGVGIGGLKICLSVKEDPCRKHFKSTQLTFFFFFYN